jgi:hypothetical protein
LLAAVLGAFALGVAARPAIARADEAAAQAIGGEVEGPMRPEAQALYDRGLGRFQARDYAGAVADLEAGYAIEPRREFLFAEGQAKRLAGDCKGAVALYQRFLATGPPAVQVNATHIALGRCAQLLAEHPDVVVVPAPTPPAPPPPPRRWWHDPLGLSATGVGVLGIGVGVGFLVAANASVDTAQASKTHEGFASAWSTAQSRQNVGVASLVAGGVLVAAGAARLTLLRRQARRSGTLFVVSLGPGIFAVGGGF